MKINIKENLDKFIEIIKSQIPKQFGGTKSNYNNTDDELEDDIDDQTSTVANTKTKIIQNDKYDDDHDDHDETDESDDETDESDEIDDEIDDDYEDDYDEEEDDDEDRKKEKKRKIRLAIGICLLIFISIEIFNPSNNSQTETNQDIKTIKEELKTEINEKKHSDTVKQEIINPKDTAINAAEQGAADYIKHAKIKATAEQAAIKAAKEEAAAIKATEEEAAAIKAAEEEAAAIEQAAIKAGREEAAAIEQAEIKAAKDEAAVIKQATIKAVKQGVSDALKNSGIKGPEQTTNQPLLTKKELNLSSEGIPPETPAVPVGIKINTEKHPKKNDYIQSQQNKLEYTAPPNYERLGRGLVYNCSGKHWACVDKFSYFKCRENYLWTKSNNKLPECSVRDVYATTTECKIVQEYNINMLEDTNFCLFTNKK